MKNPFAIESESFTAFESDEPRESFGTLSAFEEEEGVPYPPLTLGLDTASVGKNRNPDWLKAKAHGPIGFAIIRSNWGVSPDGVFARDWPKITEAGMVRGAYMFLRFPSRNYPKVADPVVQAKAFIKKVGKLEESDLPPSLDVEFPGVGRSETRMTARQVLGGVRAAWKVLKDYYGVAPIVYTSARVWKEDLDNLPAPDLAESPLWLARYPIRKGPAVLDARVAKLNPPPVPPPWGDKTNWWIHQYQGDAVRLPGFPTGNVDLNRFNTMLKGASGDRVKWVQRRLGVSENGQFDSAMDSALRAFKDRKGLGSASGVDVRTFAYLCWSTPPSASNHRLNEEFSITPEAAFEFEEAQLFEDPPGGGCYQDRTGALEFKPMEDFEGYKEEAGPETAEAPANQLEWSEDELQYSIIVSPTSPGDDRFRITARSKRPSTLMFPFSTICLLERNPIGGGSVSRVTGTLIAPQVVLTAKHCLTRLNVRTAAEGPRFTSIRVTPGADLSAARNQRPADPASITAPAARFRVHPTLDFGVIILPKAFRRPVQFMHLQPRSDVNTATLLTIAGYPCDKPKGTMWGHSEKIELTDISPAHLKYTIDTCPGHSGSPVWLLGNSAIRLLLGVHTKGPAGCNNDPASGKCRPTGEAVTPVPGKNGGVRVTCEVIDHITAWCREFRVAEPTVDPIYRERCTK
jgi:protease YdgD